LDFLIDFLAERGREMDSKSRMRRRRTAFGGDREAVVLEFESISRKIASKKSMRARRRTRRASQMFLNQHSGVRRMRRRRPASGGDALRKFESFSRKIGSKKSMRI